jgi:hypothetical protein
MENNVERMTAIEMKYSLFRDIDSISDESVLYKLTVLVKSMLLTPRMEQTVSQDDSEEIPEFVRNMSVKTGIPGNVDAKELMHQHWVEAYGKGLS